MISHEAPQTDPTRTLKVRAPSVAGAFYPAQQAELLAMLGAAREQARVHWPAPYKILISAHAGLRFSGPIAASAYASCSHLDSITRAVIFCPAHRVGFKGVAAPSADAFSTPAGDLKIDASWRERALSCAGVSIFDAAFTGEHAIETQLIFLAHLSPRVEILPLIVGECDHDTLTRIVDKVYGGDETLIVISSDLSHYHAQAQARAMDADTIAAIERLDASKLNGQRACGWRAISAVIDVARRRDLRAVRLDVRTSGDTTGAHDRVVGYPAMGLLPARQARMPDTLSNELLRVARQSLASGLRRKTPPAVKVETFAQPLQSHAATFVTLTLDQRLRGCIGSMAPHRALVADVAHNAFKAGFADPRFAPMSQAEIERAEVSISILSHPRLTPAEGADALAKRIEPEKDGLILRSGDKQALFLPQVWKSIHDPAQFIAQLARKAGLDPAMPWPEDMRAWRFVTETIGLS